jgi:hypothetical protein
MAARKIAETARTDDRRGVKALVERTKTTK